MRQDVGPGPGSALLSDRQLQLMRGIASIASGQTNEQIAEELYLSARTVAHQVSDLLAATDVSNRAELVALGYVAGCLASETWPPELTGRRRLDRAA